MTYLATEATDTDPHCLACRGNLDDEGHVPNCGNDSEHLLLPPRDGYVEDAELRAETVGLLLAYRHHGFPTKADEDAWLLRLDTLLARLGVAS